VYRLGDKVSVEVESIDRFKRQIDFHIANSKVEKTSKKRNKRR
jgi:hypothetical protein